MYIGKINTNSSTYQQRQVNRNFNPTFGTKIGANFKNILKEFSSEIDAKRLQTLKNIQNNGYDNTIIDVKSYKKDLWNENHFELSGDVVDKAQEIIRAEEPEYQRFWYFYRGKYFLGESYNLLATMNKFDEKKETIHRLQYIHDVYRDTIPLDQAILINIKNNEKIVELFNTFKKEHPELCITRQEELLKEEQHKKSVKDFLDNL